MLTDRIRTVNPHQPRRTPRTARRTLVAGLASAALSAGQLTVMFAAAGPVGAASTSSPVVTFAATSVSAFTARASYTVNRAPRQIAGVVCSLTPKGGAASNASCGAVTASTATSTSYAVTLSGLNAASYTYQATVKLTDGGKGANSTGFTVKPVAALCTVTPYSRNYDTSPHTATGTCTGVGGVNLSADLNLTGTTHTAAGAYPADPWSFTDPSGNYTNPGGTIGDTIAQATANCTVTPYRVTYDASPHTATGTCTGVGGVDLSADLNLTGTTHTAAGAYPADPWSFTDPSGNYTPGGGTVGDAIDQAITAPQAVYPSITIDPGDVVNQQTPIIPPNPGVNSCPAQVYPDGGCAINDLDGSVDNSFDATGTVDPNPDPAHDTITYQWQLFYGPILGLGGIQDAGITGHNSPVLHIAAGSLPELASDARFAADPYWRAELTTTINGTTTTSVWFRFTYSSDTSYDFFTACQDDGAFAGFSCADIRPDLLPVGGQPTLISFTSTPPVDAVVGGGTYTPTAASSLLLPITYSIDGSATSVCSIGSDGTVTLTAAGTCAINANQFSGGVLTAQAQQRFTVSVPLAPIPQIQVNYPNDPQVPVIPPNPGIANCPPQDSENGGCAINPLDGTITNVFDARSSIDPNLDPSRDTVTYHWQIFWPFGSFGDATYNAAGISGYRSPVLTIAMDSLPDLSTSGSDIYWRAGLTVTVNGQVSQTVYFRFIYASDIPIELSTSCLITGYDLGGGLCSETAPQLLPATEPT